VIITAMAATLFVISMSRCTVAPFSGVGLIVSMSSCKRSSFEDVD